MLVYIIPQKARLSQIKPDASSALLMRVIRNRFSAPLSPLAWSIGRGQPPYPHISRDQATWRTHKLIPVPHY
jgi:hypothetical protein